MIKIIFKNLFKAILIARDFNIKLKMMGTIIPKVKRYRVKITEVQIGILEYCAFLDIKDFHELKNLTKIEKPSFKHKKVEMSTIKDWQKFDNSILKAAKSSLKGA